MKNTFGWVHLGTPDPKAAKDFYEHLFRWNITPMGQEGHKSYMEIDAGEGPCAGIQQGEEAKGAQWIPFVSVSDIHEYEKKAKDLGADIVLPIMDLGDNKGFISVLLDPTGAVIGIHSMK